MHSVEYFFITVPNRFKKRTTTRMTNVKYTVHLPLKANYSFSFDVRYPRSKCPNSRKCQYSGKYCYGFVEVISGYEISTKIPRHTHTEKHLHAYLERCPVPTCKN